MKNTNIKKFFNIAGLFFLLFLTTRLYAQTSEELIGTWTTSSMDFVKITKDRIFTSETEGATFPGIFFSSAAGEIYWNDPYKDGVTIKISNKDKDGNYFSTEDADIVSSYLVTNSTLVFSMWKGIVLNKVAYRPPSALIGNWILPQEDGDIKVTISKTQMTLQKGNKTITKEIALQDGENEIASIVFNTYGQTLTYYKGKLGTNDGRVYYSFVDNNHVIIKIHDSLKFSNKDSFEDYLHDNYMLIKAK